MKPLIIKVKTAKRYQDAINPTSTAAQNLEHVATEYQMSGGLFSNRHHTNTCAELLYYLQTRNTGSVRHIKSGLLQLRS